MKAYSFLGDHLKYTEKKTEAITSNMIKKLDGNTKKSFFWTLPQHNLLNNEANSRLIMMADFGTGKTSLLFEKATRLLQQKKNVVVVIYEDDNSHKDEDTSESKNPMNASLLTSQYRLKLSEVVQKKSRMNHGVYEVVGLTEKGNKRFSIFSFIL